MRAARLAAFLATSWLIPFAGVSTSFAQTSTIVVNECSTGSSGWIELLNRGQATVDLARDPPKCFLVDDVAAGGAPKVITDANVNHASGSTACASAGRRLPGLPSSNRRSKCLTPISAKTTQPFVLHTTR